MWCGEYSNKWEPYKIWKSWYNILWMKILFISGIWVLWPKYNSNTKHDHMEILWDNVAQYWPVMKFSTHLFTYTWPDVNNPTHPNSKTTFQSYGQSFKFPFKLLPHDDEEDPVYSFLVVEQCLSFRLSKSLGKS